MKECHGLFLFEYLEQLGPYQSDLQFFETNDLLPKMCIGSKHIFIKFRIIMMNSCVSHTFIKRAY